MRVRKDPPASSTFSMDCRATDVRAFTQGLTSGVAKQDMDTQQTDQREISEIAVERLRSVFSCYLAED